MARYIEADALQRRICGAKCGCEYEDCGCEGDCAFDHFISHAPTADVAPRAEVAMEMIGIIEKVVNNHLKAISMLEPQNDYCEGGKKAFDIMLKVLAELKKKYTGEE